MVLTVEGQGTAKQMRGPGGGYHEGADKPTLHPTEDARTAGCGHRCFDMNRCAKPLRVPLFTHVFYWCAFVQQNSAYSTLPSSSATAAEAGVDAKRTPRAVSCPPLRCSAVVRVECLCTVGCSVYQHTRARRLRANIWVQCASRYHSLQRVIEHGSIHIFIRPSFENVVHTYPRLFM